MTDELGDWLTLWDEIGDPLVTYLDGFWLGLLVEVDALDSIAEIEESLALAFWRMNVLVKETLWEIAGDLRAIMEAMEEIDGELSPQTEEMLDRLSDKLAAKMSQCSIVRATFAQNAALNKEEAARLADRAKVLDNAAGSMGSYMRQQLKAAGLRTLVSPDGSRKWWVQKTQGRVMWETIETLPASVLIPQPPEVDSAALRALLVAGVPIDGARIEPGDSFRES